MTVDGLAAFLRACIDDDEAAAHLAQHRSPTPWKYFGGRKSTNTAVIGDDDAGSIGRCGGCGEHAEYFDSQAMHIARWDPARVLAEVAAKRAILDLAFKYEAKIDGEWGCGHNPGQIERGECCATPVVEIEMLRALAQPYAGRPGYDPGWGE